MTAFVHLRRCAPARSACALALALALTCAVVPALPAQSLLDRPPNISGDWVVGLGTVQFNFLHRFVVSDAPLRKVSNFPTFALGVGLPLNTMIGLHYATNSTLTPQFPNEWEFFGRLAVLSADRGAPLDLASQVGYNIAAEGLDGEVTVAKRIGPVRVLAVGRGLSDPFESGNARFSVGAGATLRLSRFIALAGDVSTLTDRSDSAGEKVAWSAGLHLAIPNTPHTLSLQATNTNTATLQGVSRGDSEVRYGFEFTVPITLARIFGGRGSRQSADTALTNVPPERAKETVIRGMRFPENRIEIDVGTVITWRNEDPLAHTVTARDGTFDSGLIEPGDQWSKLFDTPGTYDFFCTPHPFMTGVVVVRGDT
jgi:plastocyanin